MIETEESKLSVSHLPIDPEENAVRDTTPNDFSFSTKAYESFSNACKILEDFEPTVLNRSIPVNANQRNLMLHRLRNSAKTNIMVSLLPGNRCSLENSLSNHQNEAKPNQLYLSSDFDSQFSPSQALHSKKFLHANSLDCHANQVHRLRKKLTIESSLMPIEEDKERLMPHTSSSRYLESHFSKKIFYENEGNDTESEQAEKLDPNIKIIRGQFHEIYEEIEIIGHGTSAIVKKCKKISSGEYYAVKIMKYGGDVERLQMVKREFKRQYQLDHKHIVKVYELYIDVLYKKVFIIMELIEGSELSEHIESKGSFSEEKAAQIFKQILNSLVYLHAKGICHRDIKPNNILISHDAKTIKITDFGVAKFIEDEHKILDYSYLNRANYKMYTQTGTKSFNPPEYYTDSEYTESLDMWSAGVTLYIMLTGSHPFEAEYLDDQIDKIIMCDYDLQQDKWKTISDEAKDLVRYCLKKDYHERYTPSQALMHPWISQDAYDQNHNYHYITESITQANN